MKQTVFPLKYKTISADIRKTVLKRDEHTCQKCFKIFAENNLEVHHKIPVRKGGTHDLENLMTVCKKHHKLIEPVKLLNYAYSIYKVSKYTLIKVDKKTNKLLESLAEFEGRTKIGEIRFLIKERIKDLNKENDPI